MEGIDKPRCFFEGDCGGEMSGGGWTCLAGLGSDVRLEIYQGWIGVGFRRLAEYA